MQSWSLRNGIPCPYSSFVALMLLVGQRWKANDPYGCSFIYRLFVVCLAVPSLWNIAHILQVRLILMPTWRIDCKFKSVHFNTFLKSELVMKEHFNALTLTFKLDPLIYCRTSSKTAALHKNFALSITCSQLSFMFGVDKTENEVTFCA